MVSIGNYWHQFMDRLKKLFSDYVQGKSTHAEKHIVDCWYDKKVSTATDRVSDEEAEAFNRHAWTDFVKRHNRVKTGIRWNFLFIYSGIAAVIIPVVVVLLFSFHEANSGSNPVETAQIRVSRQFVTDKNMKKITLADGSVIHMNLGTTISMYEGKFNAHQREIWLDEGEAFFEVTTNASRPFVIHTRNGLSTRVVGTSFNIRSYKALDEQVISVKTGRVQVTDNKQHNMVIDPHNKISYRYDDGQIVSARTDANNIAAWQTGIIIFENADLKEIAFRLKQVFDIDLNFEGIAYRHDRIYASFARDTPLQEILEDICKLYDADYAITKKSVKLFN